MKILALSDIHRDISFIKDMAKKGKESNVDLVILAGDLADDHGRIDGMIGPFKEQNLDVAILPGNHEGLSETYFLTNHYNIKHLHGKTIKHGKIGIFGCGYADVGVHQLTEQEFFQTLKDTHKELDDCEHKIMVSHVQPSDSILGIGIWPGSTGVRKAVEELQPSLHICGHIHETHGMEDRIKNTRIINVGKTGTLIEINEENGEHKLSRL